MSRITNHNSQLIVPIDVQVSSEVRGTERVRQQQERVTLLNQVGTIIYGVRGQYQGTGRGMYGGVFTQSRKQHTKPSM